MRTSRFLMVVIVLGLSGPPVRAVEDGTVSVTNNRDSGPGSFRAAVEAANRPAPSEKNLVRHARALGRLQKETA